MLVDSLIAHVEDSLQIVNWGRTLVYPDLINAAYKDRILAILDEADTLIEGFRPSAMEHLRLFEPDSVMSRRPRHVYGRMTDWGLHGLLENSAWNDINYISLLAALAAMDPQAQPMPQLNLLGDYGGSSIYLVLGVLAAVYDARNSGIEQAADAPIKDGVIQLLKHFIAKQQRGHFVERRESNICDGATPWYGVYLIGDGKHIRFGAIGPLFSPIFIARLGIDKKWIQAQHDKACWGDSKNHCLRSEWEAIFAASDTYLSPVLALSELMTHHHNNARGNFFDLDGVTHPSAAPRFSHTPSCPVAPPPANVFLNRWNVEGRAAANNRCEQV